MYSRGNNAYGQQPYGQNPAPAYPGNSIGGTEGGSQLRAMLGGGSQDADNMSGYRAATTQYGGLYGSVYGSSALSGAQQAGAISGKVTSEDYVSSSSHGYGQKADQLSGKLPDYPSLERRGYGDHQSTYIGRDLQTEPARRYAESAGLGSQHQPELYDHIEQQASLLRQQQLLKSQALQSAALDGSTRQSDYLAARSAALRHAAQDITSYGGRMDADPRNLSMLDGGSYGQHQASILGAAPRRNIEDLMYAQGSTAGYGVSLPPGRDYAAGKGLRGASPENDYPGSLLSRGGHPSIGVSRIDEGKDDRAAFRRELEKKEERRRREREIEREREKDRDREREREREKERKRARDRREKEKERDRKRGPDIKRELTPPRTTRDRHGSSSVKDERSLRRDSPRHDALHRRHSPVRERRREYVCKVHPSSLVEVERDYQSLVKRYPNLSISPEFSKVVVNWPKGKLELSFHTPVSFEHDVIDLGSSDDQKNPSSKLVSEESGKSKGSIVWNAKLILMSGLSKNALDSLSSDKSFDDRIPHINNILRFAFLRKDRSFIAIGGPCDVADGSDPSVDDSSLVQAAIRHSKDIVQLDLSNCQRWNRFLEIHYDRVGKDGLFSHKEITVLFLPDLSECLPALSAWRDQWFAYRKSVTERERVISSKTEKSAEKGAVVKGEQSNAVLDKDGESSKTVKIEGKPVKKEKEQQSKPSDQDVDGKKTMEVGSETQANEAEKEKIKDGVEVDTVKKETETVPNVASVLKSGKKKIVKKILKPKVVEKQAVEEKSSLAEGNEKVDEKNNDNKQAPSEVINQQNEVSVEPSTAKPLVRKKIVKKVAVGKSAKKENTAVNSDGIQTEITPQKEQEEKLKDKVEAESSVIPESGTKPTTRKKIIKKVPKKKATDVESKAATGDSKKDVDKDKNELEIENAVEKAADAGTPAPEVKDTEKKGTKTISKMEEGNGASKTEKEIKNGKSKEGKVSNDKKDSGSKIETDAAKGKGSNKDIQVDKKAKTKDEKDKEKKDESRHKSNKETREKGKPDEPPQHPGFILQTRRTKESKVRSMSLSLDSLLDYNDKDIEESTFELSLFAESIYEMLQYQMGCRLLSFLQSLRLNFVTKRNHRKRHREESTKEDEKENSAKRLKTKDEAPKENVDAKTETPDDSKSNEEKTQTVAKEESCAAEIDDSKMDDESDEYDPEEENLDEDQEMHDESNANDSADEAMNEDKVTGADADADADANPEKEIKETKDEAENETKVDTDSKGNSNAMEVKNKSSEVKPKVKAKAEVKEPTVDNELLQAFRFFDRNRVGYIKVEDLRFILHNLGQYLSHRDVKELVQSALLESNTARDNRILYTKLVKSS